MFNDEFTHMTDDERFDYARVKVGPKVEHRFMTEKDFVNELDELWGSHGIWQNLITEMASESYDRDGVASLEYWATDEANVNLRENFPKHPSQPGFDPFDIRHRRSAGTASEEM